MLYCIIFHLFYFDSIIKLGFPVIVTNKKHNYQLQIQLGLTEEV